MDIVNSLCEGVYLFAGCLGTRGHQDHAAVLAGLEKGVSGSHAYFSFVHVCTIHVFHASFLFNFLGYDFLFEKIIVFPSRCVPLFVLGCFVV